MPNIMFQTSHDKRGKPILMHAKGQLDGGDAVDLGMLLYEPKSEQDPHFGSEPFYFYPDHPRNRAVIRRLKSVWKSRGYGLKLLLRDGRGEDASDILLPERVHTLLPRWASIFGGTVRQADKKVMTLANDLIVKHHPHLANAAILVVMEDFEPAHIGSGWGIQGEVWGYCQILGGQYKALTGYDFKIVLCEGIWNMLKSKMRTWLLDHELMHADRDDRGRWCIRGHDIEMFTDEVQRYPNMEPLLEKVNRLASSMWLDDEGDDEEEEEVVEVVKPKVKKKPKKRKKSKKSEAMTVARKQRKRLKVAPISVPLGTTNALRKARGGE